MENLEVIRKIQQAVGIMFKNYPDLAMYLSNLSTKLGSRFERTGIIIIIIIIQI